MLAIGDKEAITPLTESVEHVGWCRKRATVFFTPKNSTFIAHPKAFNSCLLCLEGVARWCEKENFVRKPIASEEEEG